MSEPPYHVNHQITFHKSVPAINDKHVGEVWDLTCDIQCPQNVINLKLNKLVLCQFAPIKQLQARMENRRI